MLKAYVCKVENLDNRAVLVHLILPISETPKAVRQSARLAFSPIEPQPCHEPYTFFLASNIASFLPIIYSINNTLDLTLHIS